MFINSREELRRIQYRRRGLKKRGEGKEMIQL